MRRDPAGAGACCVLIVCAGFAAGALDYATSGAGSTPHLAAAESVKRLAALGADAVATSAADFVMLIKSDLVKWGKVVQDNGIRGG